MSIADFAHRPKGALLAPWPPAKDRQSHTVGSARSWIIQTYGFVLADLQAYPPPGNIMGDAVVLQVIVRALVGRSERA